MNEPLNIIIVYGYYQIRRREGITVKKRLLGTLLALCMLITLLPVFLPEVKVEAKKAKGTLNYNTYELKEGTKCPVCGSVHHPEPAKLPEKAMTEEEFKKLQNKENKFHEEKSQKNIEAEKTGTFLAQLFAQNVEKGDQHDSDQTRGGNPHNDSQDTTDCSIDLIHHGMIRLYGLFHYSHSFSSLMETLCVFLII